MSEQEKRYEPQDKAPHGVAAIAAVQGIIAMIFTTTLIPTSIGQYAGLTAVDIRWLLFATLVSAATIALIQPMRIGRLGSGLVMLGGGSPAFVGLAGFALIGGGMPLLAMLTLCSLPAVLAFARYAHLLRRVLRPVVMGTIIMLVASSLARVVWQMSRQPGPPDVAPWATPTLFALTFVSILFLAVFASPKIRFWAPMIGIGIGLKGAVVLGAISAPDLLGVAWFGIPDASPPIPAPTPLPLFLALLPSFLILQIVVSMESYSCGRLAKSLYFRKPDSLDQRGSQGGVLANGLGTLVAGLLGALPTTTYSSTVSVIGITGVTSRNVGFWAAGILALIALSPAVLVLITNIPPPVAAGYLLFIVILMFGNGMRMATENGLDMREGILVLAGFWIGISIQSGIFSEQFGQASMLVQSMGPSIGGLLTLIFVAILHSRFRGQLRSSFVPSSEGYRDMHDVVERYTRAVKAGRASGDRLMLACEEATQVLLALRDGTRADWPAERLSLTLRDDGDSCAVEIVTLPSDIGLDVLRGRATARPSDETPEQRLELAGMRILRTLATNVTHSRYQDVDILNFSVPITATD